MSLFVIFLWHSFVLMPLTLVALYLTRKKMAMVPVVMPAVYVMCAGLAVLGVHITLTDVWGRTAVIGLLLIIGVLLAWDMFTVPRRYYLKGLSFQREEGIYDELARDIRRLMQEYHLLPWQMQLWPKGFLSLAKTEDSFDRALNDLIADMPAFKQAARWFHRFVWLFYILSVISVGASLLGYLIK